MLPSWPLNPTSRLPRRREVWRLRRENAQLKEARDGDFEKNSR